MKKLALGAILGASLMISSSAFALTAMTDANMKSATGQAGVSIAIDNVVIEQYTGSTTYTDDDGVFGAVDEAGKVIISDKHTVKQFLAMTSEGDFQTDFATAANLRIVDPTDANFGAIDTTKVLGTWNKAAALSIDVGTCNVLTAGMNDNFENVSAAAFADVAPEVAAVAAAYQAYETAKAGGVALTIAQTGAALKVAKEAAIRDIVAGGDVDSAAEAAILLKGALGVVAAGGTLDLAALQAVESKVVGVVIGLPTLMIATSADSYTVGVGMEDAINDGQNFISISKGASAMAILGGTVEIAAH